MNMLSDPTISTPAKNEAKNEARLIPNLLHSLASTRVLAADANSTGGTVFRKTHLPRRTSGDSCAN